MVEVVSNDGSLEKGTLMNITHGGFDLRVDTKEKKEGSHLSDQIV